MGTHGSGARIGAPSAKIGPPVPRQNAGRPRAAWSVRPHGSARHVMKALLVQRSSSRLPEPRVAWPSYCQWQKSGFNSGSGAPHQSSKSRPHAISTTVFLTAPRPPAPPKRPIDSAPSKTSASRASVGRLRSIQVCACARSSLAGSSFVRPRLARLAQTAGSYVSASVIAMGRNPHYATSGSG